MALRWAYVAGRDKEIVSIVTCYICGTVVKQVSSATPELAMFQHLLWIHGMLNNSREGDTEMTQEQTEQTKIDPEGNNLPQSEDDSVHIIPEDEEDAEDAEIIDEIEDDEEKDE
jgi:hypothetical protein